MAPIHSFEEDRMVTTVIAVATLVLTIGCSSIAPSNAPARDIPVRDSLVAIIETWNTAWEPQRMPEDAAVRLALAPFVHDSALTMVIDGTSISGWSSRVPRSIRSYRAATKESHHVTSGASVRLLSRDDALLTYLYRVSFERANGRRGYRDGAYTLLFRRSPSGWKIANYHGSHGREIITDSSRVGLNP